MGCWLYQNNKKILFQGTIIQKMNNIEAKPDELARLAVDW